MSDVTQLLKASDAGDAKAADQLLPLVYEELLAVNDALAALALEEPQAAKVVQMRYFVGMTVPGWWRTCAA